MKTKLGLHVAVGSRNGYGPVAKAGPACVTSLDPGAFDELPDETVKVYRTQSVIGPNGETHKDAPQNIDRMTPEEAHLAGKYYAGALISAVRPIAERYKNVFFQAVNETGGNNLHSIKAMVAYESSLIDEFTAAGLKLAISGHAGGSPHFELWTDHYVPLIKKAGEHGHIYSRHAYGGVQKDSNGNIINVYLTSNGMPGDENSGRPFLEARHLANLGINTPMVITEAGQFGGYKFPGTVIFMDDIEAYDKLCLEHDNIIGFCAWTYGNYQGTPSNIQDASADMARYLESRQTMFYDSSVVNDNPVTNETFSGWLFRVAEENRAITYNAIAALEKAITTDSFVPFTAEFRASFKGVDYALQGARKLGTDPAERRVYWAEINDGHWWEKVEYDTGQIEEEPTTGENGGNQNDFKFTHWPTDYKTITQKFGANSDYYRQFNLPGHEGIDVRAPHGTRIMSVAPGVVSQIHAVEGDHNYGVFVRVNHGDGYETTYAHGIEGSIVVTVGQNVDGGQLLMKADNSGNSYGPHLHLTLKDKSGRETIYPHNIIDPTPFLTLDLPIAPEQSTGHGKTYDMVPYVFGDGRLYEVQSAQGQERLQTQREGERLYQTKNGHWREFVLINGQIWVRYDTSAGGGIYYVMYTNGSVGAPWIPRYWRIGDSFTRTAQLQRYAINSGQPVEELKTVVDTMRLVAWHEWIEGVNGVVVKDVLEIAWDAGENYLYARNYGLVGWSRSHYDPHTPPSSIISEIHAPGQRPDNQREIIVYPRV